MPAPFRFRKDLRRFVLALIAALGLSFLPSVHAQTLTVVHAFEGGGDNAFPEAGLIVDRGGRLYGTTSDLGAAFRLASLRSGWLLNTLHNFNTGGDFSPNSKLTFGPDGNLYGVIFTGGQGSCYFDEGCGVVFKLQPPASACAAFSCPWNETVLYSFTGGSDGGNPVGEIAFDSTGNLYGAATYGGDSSCNSGCGVIYKLTPSAGGWTQSVVHAFGPYQGTDGVWPSGGVIVDPTGNVFGLTSSGGGANQGVVYELSPSNGGWSETILHSFQNLAQYVSPAGTLTRDQAGNLYGLTSGDYYDGSHIFVLSQPGTWTYSEIWHFFAETAVSPGLALDGSGNLYATANAARQSTLIELRYSSGSWSLITLHTFVESEGTELNGGLILDAGGNIYGTASSGGDLNCGYGAGCGTVWEFTP